VGMKIPELEAWRKKTGASQRKHTWKCENFEFEECCFHNNISDQWKGWKEDVPCDRWNSRGDVKK
jgi:hypothetical protein